MSSTLIQIIVSICERSSRLRYLLKGLKDWTSIILDANDVEGLTKIRALWTTREPSVVLLRF